MAMRFSQMTGTFYPENIQYKSGTVPTDLIDVSDEDYLAAMMRPAGHLLGVADGKLTISAPPAPSQSDQVKAQIVALELSVTPRRMREAALGVDGGWLKALNDQITALRVKLA